MAELALPLGLESVGHARQWVADRLDHWSDEGRSKAILVVSEMVANAVLHARTDLVVRLDGLPNGCRMAVADRSPRLPVARQYGNGATTGRGLHLIATLSQRWGIDRTDGGKSVWAEICDEPWPGEWDEVEPAVTGPAFPQAVDEPRPSLRLLSVPIPLLRSAQQQHDALRREFVFVVGSRHLSARLDQVAHEVNEHFGPASEDIRREIETAAVTGRPVADLRIDMTRSGFAALHSLCTLLDEADSYCERLEMLTLASSPDVRRLRDWIRVEIERQLGGEPPEPWPLSEL